MRVAVAMGFAGSLVAIGAGCGPRCPEPSPPGSSAVGGDEPLCDRATMEDRRRTRLCRLSGVYALRNFGYRGAGVNAWPMVLHDEIGWVALGSVWQEDLLPTMEESARYEGRRIEAIGTLHRQPPGAGPDNVALPTLAPVLRIRIVGEPGS